MQREPWPRRRRCSGVGQSDDKPNAPSSVPGEPDPPRAHAYARGSQLFFQCLLQQLLAEHLIGQHTLEPGVLLLKLLQLLGLIELHHAKLTLPAVEALFADAGITAGILDAHAFPVGAAQNADLLFGRVSFAFQGLISF